MLATSRFPSADETNAVTALGEHDRKQAPGLSMAEEGDSDLTYGVPRIIDDQPVGIGEGGSRLIERDPVLPYIRDGFPGIPLKGEGHGGT